MKTVKLFAAIIAILVITSFDYGVSTIHVKSTFPNDNKYKVELDPSEWGQGIQAMDSLESILLHSDLPTNQVVPIVNSLNYFRSRIVVQINTQAQERGKQDSIRIRDSLNKHK